MKIALAADHAGFLLKSRLVPWLNESDHEIVDLGAYIYDGGDDYPDLAEDVAESILGARAERGILICGSGVGAVITANKFKGIYACLCHDTYSARQGVEHDNMNVLCLGGRIIGVELAKELINVFLQAQHLQMESYRRRIEKIREIEAVNFK
ncbi:MAG TPA: ribose 5-phosphate isomerase B [Dehalococcoidales bacterium]|nr:ribose 5-phosphate isomerase B [Dehalococcoidales bacterium]